MEPTLDQVRNELVDIHDEFLALPKDDYERRVVLKDRQHELRALSHEMVDSAEMHDAAHLKAEYQRLDALRDRMLDEELSGASVGDDAVWGELAMKINRAIDAGSGVEDVEARLQEILAQLKEAD
jgi:cytochrome c556